MTFPDCTFLRCAAAALFLAAPALAQQDQQQDQSGGGSPQEQSSGPHVDLPLLGEVPVPGFLAGIFGLDDDASSGEGGGEGQSQGPPAVVFVTAEVQPVTETFRFLGRVEPIERVELRARVPGFIEEVGFEGGQQVDRGDLLFRIEPSQYDAALEAAQAREESARAQFTTAERSLARARELRESGTVSQAQLDDAVAAYEAARGDRLQAEAEVRQAQLDLDYTEITAPISGRMSQPFQTRGNYVSASSGPIAELTQLDPVWGVFALGENRLIEWQQLGIGGTDLAPVGSSEPQDTDGSTDPQSAKAPSSPRTGPEEDAPRDVSGTLADETAASVDDYDLWLLLPDGSRYGDEGELSFVGNSVDPTTGTVEVRVEFDNPGGLLLPNQNVTLIVTEADPPEYPVIPQAAVMLAREGRSVWVVRDDDTATSVPIEVASVDRPGEVAVTRGLEGGERVIVRGSMALRDGAEVDPRRASDGSGMPGAPDP